MKTHAQLVKDVLAGRLMLVGELRNARVNKSAGVDRNSGDVIDRYEIVYAVETGAGFGQVMIFRNAPAGVTDETDVMANLTKGGRYAFELDRLVRRNSFVNAQLGFREPELLAPAAP